MFRDPGEGAILVGTIILSVCFVLVYSTRRRSAQRAFGFRLHFERAISEIAAQFMNIRIDRLDAELSQAMVRLVSLLHVDEITLLEFVAENTEFSLTHSAEGVSRATDYFRVDDVSWYARKLLDSQQVRIWDVDQIPQQAVKTIFTSRGIKSSFSVPLEVAGRVIGALAFNSTRKGIQWTPDVVDQFRLVGNVFAAALLRKRAVAGLALSERMKQFRGELSGKLVRAQEEERSRIARELHDNIAQQVALVLIDLRRIQDIDSLSTTSKTRLSMICKKVDQLSNDVHDLSRRIHSPKLEHLGIVPALRGLCDEFSHEYKMQIESHFQSVPANLHPDISLTLFRVAQEALTNVAKHSKARHGLIELNGAAEGLVLRISDDGVGFDVESVHGHDHLGLISMQERVHAAEGELTIRSKPSVGTEIEARLPLREGSSGWERTPDSSAA